MHQKHPPCGRKGCSVCQGPCLIPPAPTHSNLGRTLQPLWLLIEAPDERIDISADLHDIKIIKKEGRLKGKWL